MNRKRRKKLEAAFEKISDAIEILDDAISEERRASIISRIISNMVNAEKRCRGI